MSLLAITGDLIADLKGFSFKPPVAYAYNPLEYAFEPHRLYLERFGVEKRESLLVGMNPGPWGMAQTGVPFGTVSWVRDWLKIEAEVGKPADEHPKRRIEGFACRREEVSGTRLWGWARDVFGTPERFFARFYIANYCPFQFLDANGRNLIPEKLSAAERQALFVPCDRALRRTVEHLAARRVIGVGAFAEGRARSALAGLDVEIVRILHPSPASPAANRGWAEAATRQMRDIGVDLP